MHPNRLWIISMINTSQTSVTKINIFLRWIAKEMTLKHETRDRLKAEVKANTAIQF